MQIVPSVPGKIQKNYRRFAFRLEADDLKPTHFASENKEKWKIGAIFIYYFVLIQ